MKKLHPDAGLIVTGHSLGAALAHHCAADVASKGIKNFYFYNFGSPRVGDPAFEDWFKSVYNVNTFYRVTHDRDPVP